MHYVVVQPVNLLPILAVIATIVLGFLLITGKRNGRSLVTAAILIVIWLSLVSWLFFVNSGYKFYVAP